MSRHGRFGVYNGADHKDTNIVEYQYFSQLRIQGAMPPLFLLKLVIKKMTAIRGALYFMFLGPPPTILDPMLFPPPSH